MELFATRALAGQLTRSPKPGNIIGSIVNPGSVRANTNRNQSLLARVVMFVLLLIVGRRVEVGGRTGSISATATSGCKFNSGHQNLLICKNKQRLIRGV
ncbi:uncharacterized protein PG986_009628 [Apiospora aurea]|uniref:Uncharacterized protein n=1 Tax=Apiospora aurea TaxID=335848 RepID=A0ABR1Q883_9PEZI